MRTIIKVLIFSLILFLCSLLSYTFLSESFLKNDLAQKRTIQNDDMDLSEVKGDPEGILHQYMMTHDPETGEIPFQSVYEEYLRIRDFESVDPNAIIWEERGPHNVGGRTRAIMWDPNDPIQRKVWAGGVSGGLYYNNNILTPSSSAWHKVDDFWSNLAISCIAYDPVNTQYMYVGTGECWFNGYGIAGLGIWSSTDGGNTWNQLPSTNNDDFRFIQKIVVHPITRDVYAATKYKGIIRSSDFGSSWVTVLGTNTSYSSYSDWATDIEINSDNDIIAALGFRDSPDGIYISPTGNEGEWFRLNNGTNIFPTVHDSIKRIELALAPSDANVIYALVENKGLLDRPGIAESSIRGIYKSTDKGQTWDSLPMPILRIKDDGDTIYFSADQTKYDLIAKVHPEDPNTIFVGGVTLHRSTDGGSTWRKIKGIHADHHAMEFKPDDPQTLLFGNDGGVYLTEDCMASLDDDDLVIKDCNRGYHVTQFHACAIHPYSGENYFLGGTQDNGTQQFKHYGVNMTNKVHGADGGFCYISESDPSYQIISTQYNNFFLSSDNGNTFNDNFYRDLSTGKFISQWDYSETHDVLYATYDDSCILRVFHVTDTINRYGTPFSYNNAFGNWVTALKLSPFTDSVLFVGTNDSRVFKITLPFKPAGYNVDLIGSLADFPDVRYINCIEVGANENQILAIFSQYNTISVWETLDGGNSWHDREGNLPDMPIYWAIYNPLDYRQVLLATELGVWTTEDITVKSPVWFPANNGLANVRTKMLRIRESDKLVIAGTYGRGLYSTNSLSVSPSTKLLASDGKEDDNFGTSVTTNGDFAIVGSPGGPMITGLEDNPGAIYIYEQINNQWTESEKILAPDGAPGDRFGISVDMDNDLAIVGASSNGTSGAAYIYRFAGNNWNLESKITPNDGGVNDSFGKSVAISGDVAAVGSYSHGDFGAVYIFNYQAGNWVQTQKLIPFDGEINDRFGYAIDLDENYLLVGNPTDGHNGTLSGSAYIFDKDGWTLHKKVYGDQIDEADQFGCSVAIQGQYAIVGAEEDEGINGTSSAGTAYVFFNSISSDWEQTAMLWAADAQPNQAFGSSVSIFDDYIIIGAERDSEAGGSSGAAYVFRDESGNGVNWLMQNKLFGDKDNDVALFGNAVHLFGTTAIVSSKYDDDNGHNSGSAYIFNSIVNTSNLPVLSVTPSSFELSSAQTTFDININNNSPAYSMDWSAYSLDPWLQFNSASSGTNSGVVTVSIDENLYCPRDGRIIIRAPGAIYSPREIFIHQDAGPNSHEVDITPLNLNELDNFGWNVDIDGESAIVSAVGDDEFGWEAGAAYIFERDGCCSWNQTAKLHTSDHSEGDNLGYSVAISGDVAIAGNVNFEHPTIYVFQKPAGGWHDMTETAKLSPPIGQANFTFGQEADISGDCIVASTHGTYPTSIMFYEKPAGGWQDMTPTEVFENYNLIGDFGRSLIIDGNYAVIGSPQEDTNTGCVYVYKRDWFWGEQARLTASDASHNDHFGKTVDLNGDLIIVGSHIEQAAYIFRNNGDQWVEEQKLTNPTGSFGFAQGGKPIAISDDIAIVGHHFQDGGCVYSYVFDSGNWSLSKQTFPSEIQQNDDFGDYIDISGPYTIINSGKQNASGQVTGGAYIFCTESDIVTSESCLAEGITFTSQVEIENFFTDHPNCTKIEGDVVIEDGNIKNAAINNLDGLSVLNSIGGNLSIKNNDHLENITGLENVTSIGGFLNIESNTALTSLSGLDNINSGSIIDLAIIGNTSLSTCEVQSICEYIAAASGNIIIQDNSAGCNSVDEVEAACDTLSISEIHLFNGLKVSPNPFTTSTTLSYTLDKPENVQFTVYNVQSKIVLEAAKESGERRTASTMER